MYFFCIKNSKNNLLYISVRYVLTLSRQFPPNFKYGEIYSLIRRHGTFLYFRFVARLWRHITFDSSIFSNFLAEPGETAKHKGEHWTTANKAKKMTKKKK